MSSWTRGMGGAMHEQSEVAPAIDLTALRLQPGSSEAQATTVAIHAACVQSGFFVITGHGLESQIDRVLGLAREFFSLPQLDKEGAQRVDRYGFVPHRATALDTSRQSDNTEYLDLGMADEVVVPQINQFGDVVGEYQRNALAIAALILESLAVALSVERSFFADRMMAPQCRLRLLHYPEVEPLPDGSLPVPNAPHTDYGALTILATDGVPGLEVRPVHAVWTPVVTTPGSLVINSGDMLARWTNDTYRSTPHRVVGPETGERFSVPFFVNPNPATIVEAIPTCVTNDQPLRYPPVRAGDFLAARIDGSTEPYVYPREGPIRHAGPTTDRGGVEDTDEDKA